MSPLLVPFDSEFMVRAIWVSGLVGAVCGFLSSFITLKGWSLMGDALSHAVVPGVALSYLMGWPLAAGAFAAGLLASGAMALVKAKSRIREDAGIGIVFTLFFALGLVMISLSPAGVDRRTILFGNVLSIPDPQVRQLVVVSGATLLAVALKWRDLMLFCFDPAQAHSLGLRTGLLHLMLLSLLSATAVAAMQTVGAILVVAMLITPGATVYLLTNRFQVMIWLSAGLGGVTSVVGAYGSYLMEAPPGAFIVTLQAVVFLFVLVLAPRHGLLASRRRARRAAEPLPSP